MPQSLDHTKRHLCLVEKLRQKKGCQPWSHPSPNHGLTHQPVGKGHLGHHIPHSYGNPNNNLQLGGSLTPISGAIWDIWGLFMIGCTTLYHNHFSRMLVQLITSSCPTVLCRAYCTPFVAPPARLIASLVAMFFKLQPGGTSVDDHQARRKSNM